MAKIAEKWVQDGDQLIQIKTQDWNPMLERAKALRENGNADFGESKLIGCIDSALINEWLKEAGIGWDDPAMDDVIKRKMLSGEFDKLRVWEGTY
tara:strand:+ start:620 stop:904 length:285 start_codon:yes stop_codon:yes gene_type:complete